MVRYVYVLEDDAKIQIEILETLLKLDPTLRVRFFATLEMFAEWIQVLMKEGSKAIHIGGTRHPSVNLEADLTPETPIRLALLVSKDEMLGSRNIPLLRKSGELFIRTGLSTLEDPTAIVITAFDNPNFDLKLVSDRIINNLIFKPFDKLILTQHLTFALDGRHPPSSYSIHNMKTDATIEMLKDVQIESVSAVGFVTRSNRAIEPGKIAKYYSDFFKAGKTRSVMALSFKCEQHPQFPQDYLCSFLYYGLVSEQVSSMRKYFANKNLIPYEYNWYSEPAHPDLNIVVIDQDEGQPDEISGSLARLFKNVKTIGYRSFADFLIDLDPTNYAKASNQPKAFPVDANFKIYYEETGKRIAKTEPKLGETQSILGIKSVDFLKSDLRHYVDSSYKIKVREMIEGKMDPKSDKVFIVRHGEFQFFIKVESRKVVEDKGENLIELSLTELNEAERKQFLMKNSRLPQRVDAVLCRENYFREGGEERWKNVNAGLRGRLPPGPEQKKHQTKVFMISDRRLNDNEVRDFGHHAVDVFYKPFERQYISFKLKTFFSQLELNDPIEIKTTAYTSLLEVGSPVKISEMSEAGVVMNYYRAISVGSFRKFVLWMPQEIGAPIYHASCNYSEEIEKGSFANHFVFFGMSDLFLKHIRLWIRDSYILSKDKGNG